MIYVFPLYVAPLVSCNLAHVGSTDANIPSFPNLSLYQVSPFSVSPFLKSVTPFSQLSKSHTSGMLSVYDASASYCNINKPYYPFRLGDSNNHSPMSKLHDLKSQSSGMFSVYNIIAIYGYEYSPFRVGEMSSKPVSKNLDQTMKINKSQTSGMLSVYNIISTIYGSKYHLYPSV